VGPGRQVEADKAYPSRSALREAFAAVFVALIRCVPAKAGSVKTPISSGRVFVCQKRPAAWKIGAVAYLTTP
jgi:hypothetical protein